MGQQQLLLIVLGVILVGIAVVVGLNLFSSNAVSANRDQLISDINNIASDAQVYYKKPADVGGGGGSFVNYTMPTYFQKYVSGKLKFKIQKKKNQVVITGIGTEVGNDGKSKIKIKGTVTPQDVSINILN